jgi:Arc/MetJ-type ribon-helix-helix transcriptional regulator
MPQASTLQVKLSVKSVEYLKKKVASGEFASESDALDDMVAARRDEDAELERWEREVVVPVHDRLMADPSSAIPIEEVERHLEEKRRQRRQLKAS